MSSFTFHSQHAPPPLFISLQLGSTQPAPTGCQPWWPLPGAPMCARHSRPSLLSQVTTRRASPFPCMTSRSSPLTSHLTSCSVNVRAQQKTPLTKNCPIAATHTVMLFWSHISWNNRDDDDDNEKSWGFRVLQLYVSLADSQTELSGGCYCCSMRAAEKTPGWQEEKEEVGTQEMQRGGEREKGGGGVIRSLWVQSYPCPECSFYRRTHLSVQSPCKNHLSLNCCKLGCAMLHCLSPSVYNCCPQGEAPSTLSPIYILYIQWWLRCPIPLPQTPVYQTIKCTKEKKKSN